jgi:hypothetical protein
LNSGTTSRPTFTAGPSPPAIASTPSAETPSCACSTGTCSRCAPRY